MTLPEYMTQKELAEILRLSPLTIHRMTKRGELKAFKVGRALRYSRADVEAYIAGRRKAWGAESLAVRSRREHDDIKDEDEAAIRELNENAITDPEEKSCEMRSTKDD